MKLTTRRAPTELVVDPTLLELLVLLVFVVAELVEVLAGVEFASDPVVEPDEPDVEPEEPDVEPVVVVPEPGLVALVGVVAVDDAVPVPESDPVEPAAPPDVLAEPLGLVAVPGADGEAGEFTGTPLVAFGFGAAGAVTGGGRFCGEYMSGSSSIVIGVACLPCPCALATAALSAGRLDEAWS